MREILGEMTAKLQRITWQIVEDDGDIKGKWQGYNGDLGADLLANG